MITFLLLYNSNNKLLIGSVDPGFTLTAYVFCFVLSLTFKMGPKDPLAM